MITVVKGSQIRMNNYFNEQSHIDVLWGMGYIGEGIRVGIVDTGIADLSHPSICDNIIKGHNFSLDGSGRNNINETNKSNKAVWVSIGIAFLTATLSFLINLCQEGYYEIRY